MFVPIERSMPAVMMTKVTPMARMPTTEVARMMLMTLLDVRKNGEAMVKKMTMMTSAPSARTRWTASDLKMDPARFSALCIYALDQVLDFGDRLALRRERHDLLLVRFAAVSSPVSRPSHMTMMRWLMRRISGSSELIMMIDLPCGGQLVEQVVDLLLGADVDASRGLIEDEDVHLRGQPLGDDDLLLVAAREVARLLADARRLDVELLDALLGGRLGLGGIDLAEAT